MIESAFFESRNAFKKVELYIGYLDSEFMNDYFNGAPLPKIERKIPELTVLDPKGFQILEEEIMAQNGKTVIELTKQLSIRFKEFENRLPSAVLSHRMVFEIVRTGLIRLASLGISGFDTPSGINTKKESKIALQAIEKTVNYYQDLLSESLQVEIQQVFNKSYQYFNVADFNEFNHFKFIQKVINPLYKLTLFAQKSLFVETRDIATNYTYSTNYESTSIFGNDFFNANYFLNYANSGNLAKKIELGKTLFYDPILSGNNQRACASCHQPSKGFADGLPTSIAFDQQGFLDRNSPGLINAIYSTRFFWDNRATAPEDQVEHVIFNVREFNTSYQEIVDKLSKSPTYQSLFNEAFPELKTINRYTIVGSLGAFVQSLRSFNSEFDKLMREESFVNDQETIEKGFNLFMGKAACATCHFIPNFSGLVPPNYTETETEVLGIPNINDKENAILDDDQGRYVNGRPKEKAKFYRFSFKTPTLRNIALTAPYMHNGVFSTLTEVVEFYNDGGGHGWGIAPENTTLPEDELNLSANEIKQLVIFMQSLTDTVGMTNIPKLLPKINPSEKLNTRKIGGVY